MSIVRTCFAALCFLIVAVCAPLMAQTDTRGREFYLTFPPNYHNNIINPFLSVRDSLYIFIAATEPTTGEITYRDIDSNSFTVNFTIIDPSKVYTFGIPW